MGTQLLEPTPPRAPPAPPSCDGRPASTPPLALPGAGLRWLASAGGVALDAVALCRALFVPRTWFWPMVAETRRQLVDSIGLVLLLAALGGALIAQQTGYQFQGTLPPWVVGSVVAASLVTEMTPLLTAFAMVGMIGTRIAAEIGAMRVSEQVDALDVMDRDPMAVLVAPRVIAALIAAPLLTALALGVSILAGWLAAVATTRADSADFWFGVRHFMRDFPPFFALIKGFCIGGAIATIGCFAGLRAGGGAAGVGEATRRAVVLMICAVVVLDTALVPLLRVVDL